MFYRGLSGSIKRSLIYMPFAATFDGLLEQCISIDQSEYALRQEEKRDAERKSKSPNASDNSKFKRPGDYRNSHGNSNTHGTSSKGTSTGSRLPISDKEYQRRKDENLCYRCGSFKHRIGDCPLQEKVPNRPPKNGQSANATVEPPKNWPPQDAMRPAS
jgi:hypothetical protein